MVVKSGSMVVEPNIGLLMSLNTVCCLLLSAVFLINLSVVFYCGPTQCYYMIINTP